MARYREPVHLAFFLAADTPPPDWSGIGLLLAIVGGFLLANSILFRHPRTLVEEHFGRRRQRWTTIREYIFHRVQVNLGFLFLLAGFGLQLYGHYRPLPAADAEAGLSMHPVGGILLAVVALELAGWWLSHRLFRRYVRQFLMEHPPSLETDVPLARELGELFGVTSTGHDTVQSYLVELRHRIGIGKLPRQVEDRRALLDITEPEREEELAKGPSTL